MPRIQEVDVKRIKKNSLVVTLKWNKNLQLCPLLLTDGWWPELRALNRMVCLFATQGPLKKGTLSTLGSKE